MQLEKGAAVQFKCASNGVFIEAALQSAPKLKPGVTGSQFDWTNKIGFKLSVIECGKILSVLTGGEKETDIIHQTQTKQGARSLANLKVQRQTGPYDNWGLKISRRTGDEPFHNVFIYLDHAESQVLQEFLRNSISKSLGF